ncbi:MAG: nucleotidyltransferase domain-containing protein [Anaerolineae bacterium]|nr:nucleotidyltransferase domain-containing protein [Anaerolineae bacterium]
MDAKPIRDIAEALIRALGYLDDERVRAVFLVGSSASGAADEYSDVDVMVAVSEIVADDERLQRLRAAGCRNIMLAIAGLDNPALPVQSQVIDKFVFRDVWFDVSYHLPDQLEFCFDYATLLDRDNLTPQLCAPDHTYGEEALKARAQADLRLLHARIHRYEKYARREEWVGLDLAAIKNLVVDLLMVLNDQPNYNRHFSHMSRLLRALPVKPENFERDFLDILRLDDRETWQRKLEKMHRLQDALTALSEARWGPISMFDDESA